MILFLVIVESIILLLQLIPLNLIIGTWSQCIGDSIVVHNEKWEFEFVRTGINVDIDKELLRIKVKKMRRKYINIWISNLLVFVVLFGVFVILFVVFVTLFVVICYVFVSICCSICCFYLLFCLLLYLSYLLSFVMYLFLFVVLLSSSIQIDQLL